MNREPTSVAQLLRSGIIGTLVFRCAAVAGALATNSALARLLDKSDFGVYSIIATVAMLGTICARFGVRQSLVKAVSAALSTRRLAEIAPAVRSTYAIVGTASALILAVLFLADGTQIVFEHFGIPSSHLTQVLILFWILILALEAIPSDFFRGIHHQAKATLFDSSLSVVLTAALLWSLISIDASVSLETTLFVTLGAILFECLIASALMLQHLSAFGPSAPSSSPAVVKPSASFFLSNLASFANNYAGTMIASATLGMAEVANYAAASRIVNTVIFPLTVINLAVQPIISKLFSLNEIAHLEDTARGVALVSAIPASLVTLVFLLFSSSIMATIFGDSFAPAGIIVSILAVGQLINALTGPCGMVLAMTGGERPLMTISVLGIALSVLAAVPLASTYGGIGIAVAMCVGNVVQNLVMWAHVKFSLSINTAATLDFRLVLRVFRER